MSKDPMSNDEVLDLVGDFVYSQGRLSMNEAKEHGDRDITNWNPGTTLPITLKWLMDCQTQYAKELAVRDAALKEILGDKYNEAILRVQGLRPRRQPEKSAHAGNADETSDEAGDAGC